MTSIHLPRQRAAPRPSAGAAADAAQRVFEALRSHEIATFLLVGGAGYVVDVATFNVLGFAGPLAHWHPVVARTIAVVVAMTVTYFGNRTLTWRRHAGRRRRREVWLFVLFNAVGFAFSAAMLVLSHDVLGLTSRLADNLSANVVGVGLGTVFRFVTYKHIVFAEPPS